MGIFGIPKSFPNFVDRESTVQLSSYFSTIVFIAKPFDFGKSNLAYTQLLDEPIKSVYLTVKMHGKSDLSPYIGNIKILLGGEV